MNEVKNIKNIAIISLLPEYANEVASLVAEQLDMYYLDSLKLFEFDYLPYSLSELIKTNKTKWVRQKLTNTIKYVCSFDNTVITFESGTLKSVRKMKYILNDCLFIYLHNDERKVKKYLANKKYETNELKRFYHISDPDIKRRRDIAKKYANIVINSSRISTFKCMGEVLREIKKYYGVEE